MTKSNKIPTVKIFYSYAHADREMQQRLHSALKPLRRSRKFKIAEWYDGCIRAGSEWGPAIIENLKRSDVILLLLSPAFVESDYCYEKELDCALQRHKNKAALVIPILLRDVAMRERKFSPFQAMPQSKKGLKPVNKWRPQTKAWESVCRQLKQEIKEFVEGGLVRDANRMSRDMQHVDTEEIRRYSSKKKIIQKEFDSVMQFWEQREQLREGDLIRINGTFSEFAPLLIGYPKGKRLLHLEFRKTLEKNPRLARKKVRTLNACLSISAGQMVWRDRNATEAGIICGLYESIIRNSIPIYITRNYYDAELRQIALEKGVETFEADVVAWVTKRDMSQLKDFVGKYGMKAFISPTVLDQLCKYSIGLLVNGEETSVTYTRRAKYLDGDIWIAGEANGYEFFESIFLDIGDPKDREAALMTLRQKLEEYPGSPRLVGQYDEASELLKAGIDLVSEVGPVEKIFRYGFDPSHEAKKGA